MASLGLRGEQSESPTLASRLGLKTVQLGTLSQPEETPTFMETLHPGGQEAILKRMRFIAEGLRFRRVSLS